MTENIKVNDFNLVYFTSQFWREVIMSPYLDRIPEPSGPREALGLKQGSIHEHIVAGLVLAEAFRRASEQIYPTKNGDEKSFYEKQFLTAGAGPDHSAEGDESVYNLAIKKLDDMLMSGSEWAANPQRVYGRDCPEGGQLTGTALGPFRPEVTESVKGPQREP